MIMCYKRMEDVLLVGHSRWRSYSPRFSYRRRSSGPPEGSSGIHASACPRGEMRMCTAAASMTWLDKVGQIQFRR